MKWSRASIGLALVAIAGVVVVACSSSGGKSASAPGAVKIVAAENFWGDIVKQLGGSQVSVTSIITDPNADPHLYESDAHDAAAVADARLVIENGLGYDDFIDKLMSSTSNSHRTVLSVAKTLNVTGDNANPHLWYDIPRVHLVAQAIVGQLDRIDPADKEAFDTNLKTFETSLQPLLNVIDQIKTRYPGAPVAYTERVPGYLLADAGLDVKTPPGFAQAIEDGNEPSAADTQAMDTLMTSHGVKVLLYNAQATSPITKHVRDLAQQAGVPVIGVTETLPPGEPNYQHWQLDQLQALQQALGG
jgi:zinc/manganese transport system substrate-binding protein